MAEYSHYQVKQVDIVCSGTSQYKVQEIIGVGNFGKVAKAINLTTSQVVALKLLKTKKTAEKEIEMLKAVKVLDPVKSNVVHFFETFDHLGQTCMVFEKLDRSLEQLMKERQWKHLSLNEIRPITQQLLTALTALKTIGVVHADIKLDNIMLVNHTNEPFRVKLVDFGASFHTKENPRDVLQSLSLKSPEVILGLAVTEAIDIWGLGVTLVRLYLSRFLFTPCKYYVMKDIVDVLGQPADHLLDEGYYTKHYFRVDKYWHSPKYWMKSKREFEQEFNVRVSFSFRAIERLNDLLTFHGETQDPFEKDDLQAFVSLIKCLLEIDPARRITPEEALRHPFITMNHIMDGALTSNYVDEALSNMTVIDDNGFDNNEESRSEEPPATPQPLDAAPVSCNGSNIMPCEKVEEPAHSDQDSNSDYHNDESKESFNSKVKQVDIVCSGTNQYKVQEIIREGNFGKVAKAINLTTSQVVALKLLKTKKTAKKEIEMLKAVKVLDPVKFNVVNFFETFEHLGQTCMVFEKLDRSLEQLMEERQWKHLSLNEIRPITQQLLIALTALSVIGVVHADIKPDNIMLVNHTNEPFRIKLADFGVSFHTKENPRDVLQPLSLKSPEVMLGLPVTEAIDIWGLGVTLVRLYLSCYLFTPCKYYLMKDIVDILGQPADHLLDEGYYTKHYFSKGKYWYSQYYWMKTTREFEQEFDVTVFYSIRPIERLNDLLTFHGETQDPFEKEDRQAFVSLIKCLLEIDPARRITPEKALRHPFITMNHIMDGALTSDYVDEALSNMTVIDDNGFANNEESRSEEPPATPQPLDAAPVSCDGSNIMPYEKVEEPAHSDQDSNSDYHYSESRESFNSNVKQDDIVCSGTNQYKVQEIMGVGNFGKVAKAINLTTSQVVALKLLKTKKTAKKEIEMLKAVKVLDPVKSNVVHFFETFEHLGQTCMVFEKLDRSLEQLMKERQWKHLSLNEIRPITQQLLTALTALKTIGVVHADIKPDNIMLVNHTNEPFRVKLVDFGVSFHTKENPRDVLQPLSLKSPEVMLGLPVTEAIDIWGLGVTLVRLYLSTFLFTPCKYYVMKDIVDVLGQPADHLLDEGYYTKHYFRVGKCCYSPKYWMKTTREFEQEFNITVYRSIRPIERLNDLLTFYPETQDPFEKDDLHAFVSLIKCLLEIDPARRITPEEALRRHFITMNHIMDGALTNYYVDEALSNMAVTDDNGFDNNEESRSEEPPATPQPLDVAEEAADSDYSGPAEELENEVQREFEEPPAEAPRVRTSRMKRMRKFFGRIFRRMFSITR